MTQSVSDTGQNNTQTELDYRKCQGNIIACGSGMKLFCIWSCLKLGFFVLLDSTVLAVIADEKYVAMLLVLITAFQGADIVLKFVISGRAKKYALGKTKSMSFIPLCLIPTFFSLLNIYIYAKFTDSAVAGLDLDFSPVLAMIIECTSLVVLVILVLNAFRIRRLAAAGREI